MCSNVCMKSDSMSFYKNKCCKNSTAKTCTRNCRSFFLFLDIMANTLKREGHAGISTCISTPETGKQTSYTQSSLPFIFFLKKRHIQVHKPSGSFPPSSLFTNCLPMQKNLAYLARSSFSFVLPLSSFYSSLSS